jgi:apolipoprotein N-acyltransferase
VPAIPFIGPVPFKYWGDNFTLAFTGAVAMAFVETARYMVGGLGYDWFQWPYTHTQHMYGMSVGVCGG